MIKETKKTLNINQYLVLWFLSYFGNKKLPSMLVKEWLVMLYIAQYNLLN